MSNLRSTLRARHGFSAILASLLFVLAGCTQGPEEGEASAQDVDLPDWLEVVSPLPGAEGSATNLIEVQHNQTAELTGVRMLIDGVDVTASALPNEGTNTTQPFGPNDENSYEGEGLLAYDPNTELMPVEIDPGQHTVTLEQVRQPEPGADLEVLDTFEWTFTVR